MCNTLLECAQKAIEKRALGSQGAVSLLAQEKGKRIKPLIKENTMTETNEK